MDSPNQPNMTRGKGLLEPLLAKLRARRANRLIPPDMRSGRILDIGCGTYPYFLSHTSFMEKYAVEQNPQPDACQNITWHQLNLNHAPTLPFPNNHFSVVTMLAVVEHLDPSVLVSLFSEIHRALVPGGILIITTPAAWSDKLLRTMARVRLVSAEEIDEHAYAYTLPLLGWYFGRAQFDMTKTRYGYFECGLNMWATAQK